MAKNKISQKEVLDNILDSFYELDMNDETERKEILQTEEKDNAEWHLNMKESLLKIERNAKITIEKHKKNSVNLYEEAKKLFNSIPNINEYLKKIFTPDEVEQFSLAFRNFDSESSHNIEDIKKEMLLLKFIKDLKNKNEQK